MDNYDADISAIIWVYGRYEKEGWTGTETLPETAGRIAASAEPDLLLSGRIA